MGSDLNTLCRGIVLGDNDVVVIVIEIVLIASAYIRVRDGILLEVIVIARGNSADALDAIIVVIVFSTLCVAQDNPADGIAVVGFYGDARTLCQLIDGIAARSFSGFAAAERDFYLPLLECSYRAFLAYFFYGFA